jgi:PRTRC genetic system ThiF family protein
MNKSERAHIVDNYMINPGNPVIVNLIGAGGTGSQVLSCLARMNEGLRALQHPGLYVRCFDSDEVSAANLGRQLFALAELGMNKAAALINRFNRFYGTNWKAIPTKYNYKNLHILKERRYANLTITCVDNAESRFEIAKILKDKKDAEKKLYRPIYWMDFGNSRYTGQAILATIGDLKQPASQKYETVANLPFITEEFKELLQEAKNDDTPSCSLAEALHKQDLFINSTLANLGASLLWQIFTEGVLFNRGFFLNLKDFRTQPIPV